MVKLELTHMECDIVCSALRDWIDNQLDDIESDEEENRQEREAAVQEARLLCERFSPSSGRFDAV